MRIHVYMAIIVILLGGIFKISAIELAILGGVIALVMITELINTAVENNLDLLNGKKFSPQVKIIKDMVAAAVLIATINAAIIGSIVFLPHIISSPTHKSSETIEFKKSPVLQHNQQQGQTFLCLFRLKGNAQTI